MPISRAQSERFDAMLAEELDRVPDRFAGAFDEIAVIVEDRPSPELAEQLRAEFEAEPDDDFADLCGLHTGRMLVDRSVEDPAEMPDSIHIFREGILAQAADQDGGTPRDETIRREIRITLLHELGHHFGLDEDDLESLGYA